MDEPGERKCLLCGASLESAGREDSGEFPCRRCGTAGRYEGETLVAVMIPNYHRRLMELDTLNSELLREIEVEGMKGPGRDMRFLQKKHLERQDVLCEFAFLSHFSEYVDRW